jgi:hypothetical protein
MSEAEEFLSRDPLGFVDVDLSHCEVVAPLEQAGSHLIERRHE